MYDFIIFFLVVAIILFLRSESKENDTKFKEVDIRLSTLEGPKSYFKIIPKSDEDKEKK